MRSSSINSPGRDEAIPDIQPTASMERLETICPADWAKCPSSSSMVPIRDGSMRSTVCSTLLNTAAKTGSM